MSSASGHDAFGAGALDRRVKLLAGAPAREPKFGGQQVAYAELATVWANVTESAGANATGSVKLDGHVWPHKIRIRMRADVCKPLRVQLDDGRIVQIQGIARLGRRFLMLAGLELGHQQA